MLRRILGGLLAALLGGGIALVLPTAPASAGAGGSFVVTTTADGYDEDGSDGVCEITDGAGDCSLRAAIDLSGSSGLWDITVPAGTYELDEQLYAYDLTANIHGAGVGDTIVTIADDAESAERHLELNLDGDIDITLSDMTFVGGTQSDGGSILARGGATLTLERMHFLDNTARGSGGAIAFYGNPSNRTLFVDDSTFAGNTAGKVGGAIHVADGETAHVTNSTFTGNQAGLGGALFVGNFDENGEGTAVLTHVTMSGNMATGFQGDAADAGGAIALGEDGDVTIVGSLIEDSIEGEPSLEPAAVGDPIANCYVEDGSSLTSGGGNTVSDDTCNATEPSDQEDTAGNAQALGDNGGPTFTMALLADSPAVDAAGATCDVPDDQRGIARPQDGNDDGTNGCDSGAYERPAVPDEPPAARPATAAPNFTG